MKNLTLTSLLIGFLMITGCSKAEKKETVKPPRIGLHVAVIQNNLDAIKQHIAADSDLNVKDPNGGSSPLITAALFGKTEIAKALIEGGADLNAVNNEGSTALMTAAVFCRTDIVKMLLEHGADKTIANQRGSTPLDAVSVPFEKVKGVYDYFKQALGPLGLNVDYDYLEATRPKIAEMLK